MAVSETNLNNDPLPPHLMHLLDTYVSGSTEETLPSGKTVEAIDGISFLSDKLEPVVLTIAQEIGRVCLFTLTLGIWRYCQNKKYEAALLSGDLAAARSAIIWGSTHTLGHQTILELLQNPDRTASLEFLCAEEIASEDGNSRDTGCLGYLTRLRIIGANPDQLKNHRRLLDIFLKYHGQLHQRTPYANQTYALLEHHFNLLIEHKHYKIARLFFKHEVLDPKEQFATLFRLDMTNDRNTVIFFLENGLSVNDTIVNHPNDSQSPRFSFKILNHALGMLYYDGGGERDVDLPLAEYILNRGANPNVSPTRYPRTPLEHAVRWHCRYNPEKVILLLQKHKAAPTRQMLGWALELDDSDLFLNLVDYASKHENSVQLTDDVIYEALLSQNSVNIHPAIIPHLVRLGINFPLLLEKYLESGLSSNIRQLLDGVLRKAQLEGVSAETLLSSKTVKMLAANNYDIADSDLSRNGRAIGSGAFTKKCRPFRTPFMT